MTQDGSISLRILYLQKSQYWLIYAVILIFSKVFFHFCSHSSLCVCVSVCFFFLPIYSGHQVRWTYQPGSHRRKVTQDFSSPVLLRCVPQFFSREGFSHSFPSSIVKSNFVLLLLLLARSLEPVVTECKEHTIHTQTQIVASRKPKEIKHTHEGEANFTT